jgi:hypothetical protein
MRSALLIFFTLPAADFYLISYLLLIIILLPYLLLIIILLPYLLLIIIAISLILPSCRQRIVLKVPSGQIGSA